MSAFVLYLHFSDEWRRCASPEQIQGEGLIMSSQYSNQEMQEIEFFSFPRRGKKESESSTGLDVFEKPASTAPYPCVVHRGSK